MSHERDFTASPSLAARVHDTVLLELEPVQSGGRFRDNLARYHLDPGSHTFCFDEGDALLVRMVLEDAAGRRVLQLNRPPREPQSGRHVKSPPRRLCKSVTLAGGIYTMHTRHDARRIGEAPRIAFVHTATPNVPLHDANGKPKNGWWALRPDPLLDPTGKRGQGWVVAELGFWLLARYPAAGQDRGFSLLNFTDPNRPVVFPDRPTPLIASVDLSIGGIRLLLINNGPSYFETSPLVITDLGSQQMWLGAENSAGTGVLNFISGDVSDARPASRQFVLPDSGPALPQAPTTMVQLIFRYFPDGTQLGALQEGEVAIFQQCNYQGQAVVFALDTPNLADTIYNPDGFFINWFTFNKNAASVRLGNNTAVILHTDPAYTGTSQLVEADTPCLADTPIGNGTASSVQIRPLTPTILLTTRSCEHCQLVGVDLSGLDLSGLDLKGANLTGAVLTATNLAGASLEQANLDQVSAATVNLSGAFVTSASLRKANLNQGKLYGTSFLDADLEGADLGGVFLTNCNVEGCSPKVLNAASLVGAHLKNVNLAKADLSGADFSTASFYSSSPVGAGACTFSNGNCATASGATMNNTQFNQAYLVGVDFTGTRVQGVQFNSAMLIGANFSGATLTVDANVGTNSGFQNAFLQGTQLGGANLTGTSLANAFLDFRPGGNDMFLLLRDVYADFPNWHAPKQPICAFVIYSAPTSVPTANTTLTCPNTNPAGPTGCGAASPDGSNQNWNSPLPLGPNSTPPASYLLPATYTPAAKSAICPLPDLAW